MQLITQSIRGLVASLHGSDKDYWLKKLKDQFGLDIQMGPKARDGYWVLREIYSIFDPIPPELVKDCGVKTIILRNDMGRNRPRYPNHGFFIGTTVTLNEDIFYHPDSPDDFIDDKGYSLTREAQTILHEFGHGFDYHHDDLSLKEPWMKLSGWSKEYKLGLKRLIIDEPGTPKVVGEMYYDPKIAQFSRFYGSRNCWDDFADASAMYLGLKDKVPATKKAYFDNLFKKYY
jgi:hypothetical protein